MWIFIVGETWGNLNNYLIKILWCDTADWQALWADILHCKMRMLRCNEECMIEWVGFFRI